MEHCNENEHWESSNPTLSCFMSKDIETQEIYYLPRITQLASGLVRISTSLLTLIYCFFHCFIPPLAFR